MTPIYSIITVGLIPDQEQSHRQNLLKSEENDQLVSKEDTTSANSQHFDQLVIIVTRSTDYLQRVDTCDQMHRFCADIFMQIMLAASLDCCSHG
jgi:hypothetical protein